jgi:hypothetical protein
MTVGMAMRAVRFAEGVKNLLVPIEQVKQHPNNPNNGDIDNLIESIQVNGFVTAITVDANTGYIIAGNHRYQALHALGAREIPVLWVDHWDSDGAKRYLVGDNAAGKRAVLDPNATLALLQELNNTEKGLAGTGYGQAEYLRLMEEVLAIGQEIPTADGFGHGVAPSGVFQVIIDFEDQDERDEAFMDCSERFGSKARTANL